MKSKVVWMMSSLPSCEHQSGGALMGGMAQIGYPRSLTNMGQTSSRKLSENPIRMLIDALRAGKDVYVEKPITLTIDEGKQIRKVMKTAPAEFRPVRDPNGSKCLDFEKPPNP